MSSNVDYKEQELSSIGSTHVVETEPLSFDEIINQALRSCAGLPVSCSSHIANIEELRTRLARGKLHLAVLGQFNRGKSTFINALIGMNILPASVLPLTSVPTLITWGAQIRCTIRFYNGKPDLVVQQSLEDIKSTLFDYVAEERNPGNQLCVREAAINCPAPLLENGTVLIDTPGFGSTYLHNTRTALDTLVECDAALFLISADPPLTQMEVEFLKQVQANVSRIFFVLNKIDLLTGDELVTVDRFIRETLIMRMGYAHDMRLFHVCAVKGLKASKQQIVDSFWKESGMESVRSGILDFMIREKYFTLSQALTGKLKEACDGICGILQQEIDAYRKPLEVLQKESGGFVGGAQSVRKAVEREIALVEVEKNAVLKFLDEQIVTGGKKCELTLTTTLESLLANKAGVVKSVDNLAAALNKILLQSLSALCVTTISRVNKPFRKAIQVHLREYGHIRQTVTECIGDCLENTVMSIQEKLESLEVDADGSMNFSAAISTKDLASEWTDWFRNHQTRVARIRNRLETLSNAMLSENIKGCSCELKARFSAAFEGIHLALREAYNNLMQSIDSAVSRKERALVAKRNESRDPVQKLENQILAVKKVKSLMK